MYNNYVAQHAFWADTTNMDNLRGADATGLATPGAQEVTSAQGDVSGFGNTVHTFSGDTFYDVAPCIVWPSSGYQVTNSASATCKSLAENYCIVDDVTWGLASCKVLRTHLSHTSRKMKCQLRSTRWAWSTAKDTGLSPQLLARCR